MPDLFSDGAAVTQAGEAILYGAGSVGRDLCRVLVDRGIRVVCMLDRDAGAGGDYRGVPIYPLDACPIAPDRRTSTPLILSIFNRGVDLPALARALRAKGFGTIVSFIGVHAEFADALGDRFWLTRRAHVDDHALEIAKADRLWADARSRTVFRSLIAMRRNADFGPGNSPEPGEPQYLPLDVPNWPTPGPVRAVDCGAYRGDTLELMLASKLKLEASAHFEPDVENFAHLSRLVRARSADLRGPAMLWPCAVGRVSGPVSFHDGLDEGSGVGAGGSATVTAIALDDVLVGWRPTLIKMDIEGSEIDALHGARRTIAEDRPDLAVCVYHRPDHLWRIPLLLSEWSDLGSYRYYLRVHGFNGFDTVLYATPQSKEVRS